MLFEIVGFNLYYSLSNIDLISISVYCSNLNLITNGCPRNILCSCPQMELGVWIVSFNLFGGRWLVYQIIQFKWWCVINVWAIMHLDTHFLEFEFLDSNNVKPLKSKFSINWDLISKTYFWYDTKMHCMCLIY